MDTIQIVTIVGGLVAIVTSVAAFLRQNKNNAADHAAKITTLEERINNLQNHCNQLDAAEFARINQVVQTLVERVNKLDTDVENKIDKLSEKIDGVIDRMNQILIVLAKNNKDV